MTRWVWSYAVWAAWIILFLLLELPGNFRVVPWVTLSETSWHAEHTYPVVRALLEAFLIGLTIHIVFEITLWKSQLFGLVVAVGGYFLNRHWP